MEGQWALVDPDWVAARLDDPVVRVIEIDVSRQAYDEGHIPGAVLWNAYSDLRHPDYTPCNQAELARLLSASGVGPDTTVVFYGYAPYLGLWLMQEHGHDRVLIMDGARDRWESAGYSWRTEIPAPDPSSHPIPARATIGPSLQAVQAMIGEPDTVLLDVRSQAEFDGERFWPSGATEGAGRAGHIPGAVHIPIDSLRTDDGFKSTGDLRRTFEENGILPERRIVTYCTIGNRASLAWFALTELLGYPHVDVYYGSWSDWGSRTETPIEP